jgi:hypothetical protein
VIGNILINCLICVEYQHRFVKDKLQNKCDVLKRNTNKNIKDNFILRCFQKNKLILIDKFFILIRV